MKKLVLPILASIAYCGAAAADPVTIDFENVAAGTIIDGPVNPFYSVSTTGGAGVAIAFDTDNPTGGDGDLTPLTDLTPNVSGAAPSGNVLIIAENLFDGNMDGLVDNPDDNFSGGTITFDFTNDVTFFGFNGIDFTDGPGFLTVDLFGSADQNIFSFTIDDIARAGVDLVADVGDNVFFGLFENVFGSDGISGVSAARITLGGSGAIDGLTFHPGEIPVPAALPLMATAIGLGGFLSRRRKKRIAAAA